MAREGCGIVPEKDHYKLVAKELTDCVSPPGLELFRWTLKYLREKGVKDIVRLKAPITGPFTLASYIETGPGVFPFNRAISDLKLVEQIARILDKSCREASEQADLVSIDEPILGTVVGGRVALKCSEEDIIEVYNTVKKACGDKAAGTHICGRISPRLAKILLQTDLGFLSHEFYDTPTNMDVYVPKEVQQSGKILSVGCLSSKKPRIESPEEILAVMEKFRKYGDTLMFTPDCGFRPLIVECSKEKGYETSMRKLRNLAEAARRFKAAQ